MPLPAPSTDSHGYGLRLFDHHQAMLHRSGVAVDVAASRGYVSVDVKTMLQGKHIPMGVSVPGLLIPVWGPYGDEPATWQYRPDQPWVNQDGDKVRYLNPSEGKLSLDIPKSMRGYLDDTCDLVITEGAKKVDAAVSQGIFCIGLLGVHGWAKKNGEGWRVPLSDWKAVRLKGRPVYIAFDSDVMTKVEVRRALQELVRYLMSQGAKVSVLRFPPSEEKIGLDDWLGAGHDIGDLEIEEGWDHIVPKPTHDSVVDHGIPFPLDVYPPDLAAFIETSSQTIGCPLEYMAAGVLPIIGTAIGGSTFLDAGEPGSGWSDRPCLWVALVGETGYKKTPAMNKVIAPLHAISDRYRQTWLREVAQWEKEDQKTRPKNPPHRVQLGINDVTKEKIINILSRNPRGCISYQDEIGGWISSLDAYKENSRGSAERSLYLSMYSGSRIEVQRIKDDREDFVDKPFVSFLGGIQPDLLSNLGGADGLLARFIFAIGAPRRTGRLPRRSAANLCYPEIIEKVHKFGLLGKTLTLSDEALDMGDGFYAHLEDLTLDGDILMRPIYSKSQAVLIRLAIVMHSIDACSTGEFGVVSADQLARAFRLVEYFNAVASTVVRLDDGSNAMDKEWGNKLLALQRWLNDHPGVQKRDVLQRGPRWARKAEVLNTALDALGVKL